MGELPHLSNSAVLIERGDLEIILRALVAFQQASSEAAEIILRRLDGIDGDPDLEDATDAEDDFSLSPCAAESASGGLGCPIADPGGCEHDGREEDEDRAPDYGIDQTKSLPDAMVITHDRNAMRAHRDRIRDEACDKFTRHGVTDYRLRRGPGQD
ncbi:hypothetical protein [Caenibius sp. WL]|uniref:hypothetical protein n=1 Tax=Caenibius sp. WL TaxID=2872646 RepID=UPI001C99428D|nr:hypothetical protein [Caenibius sp. WL]QZP08189.1 hypothetical protein K5X80_16410 [Caenibius sp. WL]